ncbi:MAG: hypothetical protein JWO95_3411 [Verrucomicrobiales bacterium]|nr:hypothetical protein [Verrucomicrobiales bacterium]
MKPIVFRAFLVVAVAAAIVGCGTPYTYSPYVGQQKNWTTAPGGYVRYVRDVPFYPPGQYPNRPYVIVGAVSTDNEDNMVRAAHEQHADAVLVSHDEVYPTGSVAMEGAGVIWSQPTTGRALTANLIRFQ